MPVLADLTGQQFGRWHVIGHPRRVRRIILWRCRCVCGTEREVAAGTLKTGESRSCGCLANELLGDRSTLHGHAKGGVLTSTYRTWSSMLNRCSNPNNRNWSRYGGRGIEICERWKSFDNFFADMGERPPGMSIERMHNDEGYDPDNCIWADAITQMRNRRNTKFVTICGVAMPIAEACERYCLSKSSVYRNTNKSRRTLVESFFFALDRHMQQDETT